MAFSLILEPPELNSRLKVKPPRSSGQVRHPTAPTLWKEIGNARLRRAPGCPDPIPVHSPKR